MSEVDQRSTQVPTVGGMGAKLEKLGKALWEPEVRIRYHSPGPAAVSSPTSDLTRLLRQVRDPEAFSRWKDTTVQDQ